MKCKLKFIFETTKKILTISECEPELLNGGLCIIDLFNLFFGKRGMWEMGRI